jgi:hypothetical protein
VTQRPNDIWQLDYKLDHPVFGIMLGPPTPEYHAQAWHLPYAYEISINPQMGFSFLERRDKSAFTDLSFQIETWREMVLYAPQPFADLGHGVGLNTGPLGYAARTGTPDQTPQMLIGFNPHFTFNALPNLEVFIPEVIPSRKNAVQMLKQSRFWPRLNGPKAKTSLAIPTSGKACGGFWRMKPRISGSRPWRGYGALAF